MSVVRAELDKLAPIVKSNFNRYQVDINELTDLISTLQEQRADYIESCNIKIQDNATRMRSFLMDTNIESAASAASHQAIDESMLHIWKALLYNFDTRIATATSKQNKLKAEQQCFIQWFRRIVRRKIQQLAIMRDLTCSMCLSMAPLAIPNWSCFRKTNFETGQPKCFLPLCVRCVRNMIGLSWTQTCWKDKCPGCNTIYKRVNSKDSAENSYVINMHAMQMADAYLDTENEEFAGFFGENQSLNLIECSQCDMTFASISDLLVHWRASCSCSRSQCKKCHKTFNRHDLNENDECCLDGCVQPLYTRSAVATRLDDQYIVDELPLILQDSSSTMLDDLE